MGNGNEEVERLRHGEAELRRRTSRQFVVEKLVRGEVSRRERRWRRKLEEGKQGKWHVVGG